MTVHVVGAGLAGLSCALAAADAGLDVVLHESAGQAGGRCRSWRDAAIGEVIDNGTHMFLGGNHTLFSYLRRIGALDRLTAAPLLFPMIDLADGRRWTATPLRLLPSLLSSIRRSRTGTDTDIASLFGSSRNYRRFWEPIILSVMNTPAEDASVKVFREVLVRTLWRGMGASRPFMARTSLTDTFIQPAQAALPAAGIALHLNHPLRHLERSAGRAVELSFDDGVQRIGPRDHVVLAVPWVVAASLLPGLPVLPASPIVNAHFRIAEAPRTLPSAGFAGLLGGTAQWMFLRGSVLSVTVSAAAGLVDRPADDIRDQLWSDVSRALDIGDRPLAARVIKEKRATLFHSPAVEAARPRTRAGDNLFLAGDWTATGLPCTLEGSILSGKIAADALLSSIAGTP